MVRHIRFEADDYDDPDPLSANSPKCELCGEPMPKGEEMFKYHGLSGPCPKPPLANSPSAPKHGLAAWNSDEGFSCLCGFQSSSTRVFSSHIRSEYARELAETWESHNGDDGVARWLRQQAESGEGQVTKCGEYVADLIAGASWFPCVMEKGHEGLHRSGGNCLRHGPYLGDGGAPPKCPHWPTCAKGAESEEGKR